VDRVSFLLLIFYIWYQTFWRKSEREEKLQKKVKDKQAQEQRRLDIELLEAKRQQRKLNFLITQTELYAHFMARKMGTASGTSDTSATATSEAAILNRLNRYNICTFICRHD
jgi:intein/homing endonuclease